MDSVFMLAKKYYPQLWSRNRLDKLVEAGKLTAAELDSIIKESDTNGNS